ncbi:hypothetical protein QWY85_06235 [Neolewinella lacunae]|uniref:Uncharacterized protein n=1 Tax=Neolewinella lacunae TaxID=1517758 RepID=A0A923PJG8_9BACT|nr:hypothetical protein [Neolewinella lacunae]MBC6994454.1 hypothetical protein [Neolewinella lacunae]MDN3634251.1 hypothetical protein [Neolewinella lacunae]
MRLLPLLFLLLACTTTRSQPATQVVDFFIDPVGKPYYLLANAELVTDNPLGQNRFSFYDSSLGAPSVVDVSNPFAILLFYPDYGQMIVLDRTLSEVSRLDLFSVDGLQQPAALARATDNQVWVFDAWDYRLKLLDNGGNISRQSNDLRLEIAVEDPPDFIYADRATVLLHFLGSQRLAIFTNYGRFQGWASLPTATHFGWHPPFLTGSSPENAWTWTIETGARPQVPGTDKGKVLTTSAGHYTLDEKQVARFSTFSNNKN